MKTILITGSDGFLGSHLTDFLINKGYSIFALKRSNGIIENLFHYTNNKRKFSKNEKLEYLLKNIEIPTTENKLKIFECDMNDSELLEKIIIEIKPDLIYHFAAQPYVIQSWDNPRETIQTNVIGTINIFEPLKKHNIECRVIVACSSAEYGITAKEINRALKESDPLKAIHPYGISKISTELLAKQYFLNFGIDIINLRFFNQTGPRKLNDACSDFIQKIVQTELNLGEPIIEVGNLNSYRDITSYKDSIQAIWLATKKGKSGETYNICSNRKIQIRKILEICLSFCSKNIQIKENTPNKLRKNDEDIILGDNTKIKTELGFKITQSIEVLLKEMFDYWIEYHSKKKIIQNKRYFINVS